MRHASLAALLSLTLIAGCAPQQQLLGPVPDLPASLRNTVTDPARSAIGMVAAVFGNPRQMAGQPVQVANAISQYEWLTMTLATDQRWIGLPPTVLPAMRTGREELRATFGVPADAPPQAAVTAFDGAAAALAAGNRAGAEAALAALTGPAAAPRAVQLLSALPTLQRTAQGASAAQNGMMQMDMMTGPRGR